MLLEGDLLDWLTIYGLAIPTQAVLLLEGLRTWLVLTTQCWVHQQSQPAN